jgi:hypothetical protein
MTARELAEKMELGVEAYGPEEYIKYLEKLIKQDRNDTLERAAIKLEQDEWFTAPDIVRSLKGVIE